VTADPGRAAERLTRRYLTDYPVDAAIRIEKLGPDEVSAALRTQPAIVLANVWQYLMPNTAAALVRHMPDELTDGILTELQPPDAVRILACLPGDQRSLRLQRLDQGVRSDIEALLAYPDGTAGRLMNTGIATFRGGITAADTLERLRQHGMRTARSLFLVDDTHRLVAKVSLHDVALAKPDQLLDALARPVGVTVRPVDPLEVVSEAFEVHRVLDLPVVDIDGRFIGAVMHDDLAQAVHEDAMADMQRMVGVSKEERALSSPLTAVRRRMPWLQINLLTAFLAASVVGIFEQTIAQVTALAVLLPVVAGQSGNAGAQALAVTMRGLALREISARQWFRVTRKEILAGLMNGIGIAVTCGIGVYFWSQSPGLVAVICSSMVLAMIAAGFAGAVIPIVLTRLGQDPATSSSIILTTVTDVAGFFSFLGIATALMTLL